MLGSYLKCYSGAIIYFIEIYKNLNSMSCIEMIIQGPCTLCSGLLI